MDFGITAPKTFLFFISLIFWATGTGLVYVSFYVINSYKTFDDFRVDAYGLVLATIILCVAIVLCISGIIGCIATLKESKVGLGFFLVIILVIFAAEVTALVFGYIYKYTMNKDLDKSMSDVFDKYNGINSESNTVDFLQSQLECCGVRNYTDWESWQWFMFHNHTVPTSCCKENVRCTGQFNQPELLNTHGCEAKLQQLLQSVLLYALFIILLVSIIMFLGIVSICLISCQNSRNDYQPLYA